MSIKDNIDQDLKQAMLGGDKAKTTILRGLKSAILYVEVAKGSRDQGLTDPEIIEVLAKEAKKRQESADLYRQGGSETKAVTEEQEKRIIEAYLPAQLSEADIAALVDEAMKLIGNDPKLMGQIIGAVRQKAGPSADGATIARLVKGRLQ